MKIRLEQAAVLVTGTEIHLDGVRGTESAIRDIVTRAQSELHVMTYVVSKHATWLLDDIQNALDRGITTTVVINRLQAQDFVTRDRLCRWSRSHPHFMLHIYDKDNKSVHGKVIMADRNTAVVGSANFSWRGMATNYEVSVLLEGKEAWTLSKIVDRLAAMSSITDPT